MKQTHTTADPEHHVSNTKNNTITLNTPTLSTPCAGSPTAVLPLWKALLSEEDRSMWSNVEVCSQMVSRSHTPGGVGRKGRRQVYSGELGRQARTQVNRRRHSSCTASYILTCELGLGCIGNTGCYTVQWGQLGLGRIGQKSSGCTEDRRMSKHTCSCQASILKGRTCTCALQPTGHAPMYNGGRRRAGCASRNAFCGTRSALP